MKFKVKMKCDNDAFRGPPVEVVRLLRLIADKIEAGGDRTGEVIDKNGNSVGFYGFFLSLKGN